MAKVVFVDWYGVMSTSKFFEHWNHPGHPNQGDFAALQEWWLGPDSADFFDLWGRGLAETKEFYDILSSRLGHPPAWLEQQLIESIAGWQWVDPEMLTTIQALRATGLKVVLATDTFEPFPVHVVPRMNVRSHFDALLCSNELRSFKGDVGAFFGGWLREHQIQLSEAVLLDDALSAVDHFAQQGLRMLGVPHGTSANDLLRSLLPR